MKFDLDQNLFQAVLGLLQEAPVPHKVSNPIIQALIAQAGDSTIQSLQYPKPAAPKDTKSAPKKRGLTHKLNGTTEVVTANA